MSIDRCVPNPVVVVGSSAGGLDEIKILVKHLPTWYRGTMIVANHRAPGTGNVLATILDAHAKVEVYEPVDEEAVQCTTIYVGDADDRVEVDHDEFDVTTDNSWYARIHRIDDLFKSVAETVGDRAVGIILSGMLSDGVDGLEAIHRAGGVCIVQSPEDAKFDSMPRNALDRIEPHFVGTTEEIARLIVEIATKRH